MLCRDLNARPSLGTEVLLPEVSHISIWPIREPRSNSLSKTHIGMRALNAMAVHWERDGLWDFESQLARVNTDGKTVTFPKNSRFYRLTLSACKRCGVRVALHRKQEGDPKKAPAVASQIEVQLQEEIPFCPSLLYTPVLLFPYYLSPGKILCPKFPSQCTTALFLYLEKHPPSPPPKPHFSFEQGKE